MRLALTSALALLAGGASAETLTLQSAFPPNLEILAQSGNMFADRMKLLTDGELEFRFYDAGELSPPLEIFENVGVGAIDAGYSYAGYWSGRMPAANLFATMPFGPTAPKYLAWVYEGGGLELWQELYGQGNVVPIPCGAMITEAAGFFRNPITSVEDFKGINFRIGGLGSKVLAEFGAAASSIPHAEVYVSLETGRLDGVELGTPAVDRHSGMENVAKNYYLPGWQQPSGLIELLINKGKWDGFTDAQRQLVKTVCHEVTAWTVQHASVTQDEALKYFESQGVKIERLPDDVLAGLREATERVLEKEAAADETFAKVLKSYRDFSTTYDRYADLSRLN